MHAKFEVQQFYLMSWNIEFTKYSLNDLCWPIQPMTLTYIKSILLLNILVKTSFSRFALLIPDDLWPLLKSKGFFNTIWVTLTVRLALLPHLRYGDYILGIKTKDIINHECICSSFYQNQYIQWIHTDKRFLAKHAHTLTLKVPSFLLSLGI